MVKRSRLKKKASSKDKRRLKRVEPMLRYPPRGLETFDLPSHEDVLKIKRGDYVQIIFGKPYNERMWVQITKELPQEKIGESKKYEGLLSNVPLTGGGKYRLGTKVVFDAGHIIDIQEGSEKKLESFKAELRKMKPSERDWRVYKKELGL